MSSSLPRPTHITVRHTPGWAFVAAPSEHGYTTEVEYYDAGTWLTAHRQGSEHLVPVPAGRRMPFRACYLRPGSLARSCLNGHVWAPTDPADPGYDTETIPDPEPDPDPGPGPGAVPVPPSGLRVVDVDPDARTARVAWDGTRHHDDLFWRVRLESDPADRTVRVPGTTFRYLQPGRKYQWHVRTVRVDADGFEHVSPWIAGPDFGLDDTPAPDAPAAPRNIRAHCIHPRHAKIEWDPAPAGDRVTCYIVDIADTSRSVIGTLVDVGDLEPETRYTAAVSACRDDNTCSQPATVTFTTGAEAPPSPDPDPPSAVPAPTGLYLTPLPGGRVQAAWDPVPGMWWLAALDDGDGPQTWHRTTMPRIQLDAPAGQQQRFLVYAVLDGGPTTSTQISPVTAAAVVTSKEA